MDWHQCRRNNTSELKVRRCVLTKLNRLYYKLVFSLCPLKSVYKLLVFNKSPLGDLGVNKRGSLRAPFFHNLIIALENRIFTKVFNCACSGNFKAEVMANKILNEYSKGNTVAFWLTICIGIALIICIIWLFINYTAITF